MKNQTKVSSFAFVMFALSFFLIFFTSCGPKIVRKKRKFRDVSWAKVQVEGKLRIGIIVDYFPPFATIGLSGDYSGFDIELARAVARKLNLKLEIQPLSWGQKQNMLYNDKVDCIWSGFTVTENNKKRYNFSDHYIISSQVFMIRESDEPIFDSIASLKTKKIAGLTSLGASDAVRILRNKYGDFSNFKLYPDMNSMIYALKNKEVDAVLGDVLVMFYFIKAGENFKTLPESIILQNYAIAFRNGENELRSKIEAALLQLEEEGVVESLSKIWFGANICLIGK